MAEAPSYQVESRNISTAVEVEKLDTNLFRSKSLWIPFRARGVFGGQVISQALVSATGCVDAAYGLHVSIRPTFVRALNSAIIPNSLCMYVARASYALTHNIVLKCYRQCYFLLSASPAIPILYHVDRVRDGRTYTTRAVRAVQNGRIVFVMLCSFQKPELDQPSYQWAMPLNVPKPEDCQYSYARSLRTIQDPNVHEEVKAYLSEYVQVWSNEFLFNS